MKIINYKSSDFCKLQRFCAISLLQISKKHFETFDFFCKNEACVNCGISKAITLIWLLWTMQQKNSLSFYQIIFTGHKATRILGWPTLGLTHIPYIDACDNLNALLKRQIVLLAATKSRLTQNFCHIRERQLLVPNHRAYLSL